MTKITITVDDNTLESDKDTLFHHVKWVLKETSGEDLTIEHITIDTLHHLELCRCEECKHRHVEMCDYKKCGCCQ